MRAPVTSAATRSLRDDDDTRVDRTSQERTVSLHPDDAVDDRQRGPDRAYDVEDRVRHAVDVENVLGPPVDASRHAAEAVLQRERHRDPVVGLELRHRDDHVSVAQDLRHPELPKARVPAAQRHPNDRCLVEVHELQLAVVERLVQTGLLDDRLGVPTVARALGDNHGARPDRSHGVGRRDDERGCVLIGWPSRNSTKLGLRTTERPRTSASTSRRPSPADPRDHRCSALRGGRPPPNSAVPGTQRGRRAAPPRTHPCVWRARPRRRWPRLRRRQPSPRPRAAYGSCAAPQRVEERVRACRERRPGKRDGRGACSAMDDACQCVRGRGSLTRVPVKAERDSRLRDRHPPGLSSPPLAAGTRAHG